MANIRMKYGDYVLSDDFICIVESRPLPEFKPTSTSVDGADGESFDALTLGTRTFTITVVFKPEHDRKKRHKLARKLAGELLTREPKRFIFTDENDSDGNQLSRLAVPTGVIDIDAFVNTERWTIEFIQHNPFLIGKEVSVVLKPNESTKIKVRGDVRALPLLTANPTGTLYWLKDNDSNWLRFGGPFNGSTLNGNFAKQTLKLDPSVSGAEGLQAGSVFFEFKGSMYVKASHRTTLTWRERWIV
ncbi:MAG: phage tail family protein [Exiguobacterium sp.]|nr:phage tail family protein [Exiguobacterium sp.]